MLYTPNAKLIYIISMDSSVAQWKCVSMKIRPQLIPEEAGKGRKKLDLVSLLEIPYQTSPFQKFPIIKFTFQTFPFHDISLQRQFPTSDISLPKYLSIKMSHYY